MHCVAKASDSCGVMSGLRAQPRSTFVEAAPGFTFSGGPKWENKEPLRSRWPRISGWQLAHFRVGRVFQQTPNEAQRRRKEPLRSLWACISDGRYTHTAEKDTICSKVLDDFLEKFLCLLKDLKRRAKASIGSICDIINYVKGTRNRPYGISNGF